MYTNSLDRIFLWLNSGCNLRCRTCGIWTDRSKREVSLETVRQWIPQWRELALPKVVIVGEPTLHSNPWEICALIRESGIHVDLLSNGLRLFRFAREVVDNTDALRISLDGPPAVHNKIRGSLTSFQNIKRSVAAVRALDGAFPIAANATINRMNYRHLRELVSTAHEVGFDSLVLAATDITNPEAFKRTDSIHEGCDHELLIPPEEIDELEAELAALSAECAADFESGFLPRSPAYLRAMLVDFNLALAGVGERPAIECDDPWRSAVVEFDGTVRPCFPMPSYGRLSEGTSLKQLLNADANVAFRAGLVVQEHLTCKGCSMPSFVCSRAPGA